MLFILPLNTEEHDGRIRLAALIIIAVCVVIQCIVMIDSGQIKKRLYDEIQNYTLQKQKLIASTTDLAAVPLTEQERSMQFLLQEQQRTQLDIKLKEIRSSSLLYQLGLVPGAFKPLSLITYMFVHSGWIHLLGNLLFFYVLGLTMERYWRFWRFMGMYLLFGIGASLFFITCSNFSNTNALDSPLVGASGAVAGIMGAFLVTHPHS
ncbi:MAG: rhomboid family intramembrane serine protease, partial [Chitinivibrionales bacterium]|nr:rhomboid family intramembrane serine protease [Chitinivibrionales bacterium]